MVSGILYKPGCCPRDKKGENATERFAKTRFSYELTPHNFSYGPIVLGLMISNSCSATFTNNWSDSA